MIRPVSSTIARPTALTLSAALIRFAAAWSTPRCEARRTSSERTRPTSAVVTNTIAAIASGTLSRNPC